MEDIDKEFTQIIVKANQKCRKHAQPWSPELHQAYLIYRYWALTISSIQTKRKYAKILQTLHKMIGPDTIQLLPNETPSIKL